MTFGANVGGVLVSGLTPNQNLNYLLTSITCHTPSEHIIENIQHSLECQFLHTLDNSTSYPNVTMTKLITSVLFDSTSTGFSTFISELGIENLSVFSLHFKLYRMLVYLLTPSLLILLGQVLSVIKAHLLLLIVMKL